MKKILLSLLFLLTLGAQAQTIVYVDADATGNADGSSWADAYTEVFDALMNTSGSHVELWVAEGTYKPKQSGLGGDPRNESLVLQGDSVSVYGGFAGTETALSQRDWRTHETIFSGDIGNPGLETDNARSVVLIKNCNYAVLDGVTVMFGYAEGTVYLNENGNGGGVFVSTSDEVEIRNCTIKQNIAYMGGGLAAYAASNSMVFRLENTEFVSNHAIYVGGAFDAVAHSGNSLDINIVGCLFRENSVDTSGYGGITGRIFTNYSNSTLNGNIINCTISGNVPGAFEELIIGELLNPGTSSFTYVAIDNSIIWTGANDEISAATLSEPDGINVRNSILSNSQSESFITETNVSTADPLFVNAAGGDFTVNAGSPAIDGGVASGLAVSLPDMDLDGNQRIMGSDVDMGCFEFDPLSSVEDLMAPEITVYPNPASSYIGVTSDQPVLDVTIRDLTGKTLIQSGSKQMSVENLPQGFYLITVTTRTGTLTQRLVKE